MARESWYLEGYLGGESVLRQIPLRHFPFRIGRDSTMDCVIPGHQVSRQHAEILRDDGVLLLRDCQSTNGSFLNRERVTDTAVLQHGDILHFGDTDLRLIRETRVRTSASVTQRHAVVQLDKPLPETIPAGIRQLQELISQRQVEPYYQPIVYAESREVYGYEILGRGTHAGLPALPGALFRIADSTDDLAMHLSQLFRDEGIVRAATFNSQLRFFMNVHPQELRYVRLLLLQMERLRRQYPDVAMVLEIHEQAVPKLSDMKKICQELANMRIELAYDDFGAGQSRFIELIEAPAHYLKFDITLVRNIDKATAAKRKLVKSLVSLSRQMKHMTLAEGIEREEEMACCLDLGFDLVQGYYVGPPQATLG